MATSVLGTSHRRTFVRDLITRVSQNLRELYAAPDDYHVAFGNGGTHTFWDMSLASLIEGHAHFAVCGEFSARFADYCAEVPGLTASVETQPPGTGGRPAARPDTDVYAWVHNETSTGVLNPVQRVGDAGSLTLVDATSIAGAYSVDLTAVDAYYFSPQKALGADGGTWFAFISPAAVDRAARLTQNPNRWVPNTLNLHTAVHHSDLMQTLNTPAVVTYALVDSQLTWLLNNGGLGFAERRSKASSSLVYAWAEQHANARPFVESQWRSPVVATIDLIDVDAEWVVAACRENGIIDVDPYRKLGKNQLRIGLFPAVETSDVEALTASFDYLIERAPAVTDGTTGH